MRLEAVRDVKTGFGIRMLHVEEFEKYWPNISEMMDRVPQTWEHFTKEYFFAGGMAGALQFWASGNEGLVQMVLTTQIATFPSMKTLQIIWAAGEGVLKETLDTADVAFESFAQECGCEEIEVIDGRGGWSKVLLPYGFRESAVVLSRRVKSVERMN